MIAGARTGAWGRAEAWAGAGGVARARRPSGVAALGVVAAVLAAAALAGCSRSPSGQLPGGAAAAATGRGGQGVAGGVGSKPPPVVSELARAAAVRGRRVLFVGLDGADWQLLDGYMADGTMPNLAGLARDGLAGELQTIQPPLSPLVWTTMMTGVSPLDHRVLDFTRFNPVDGVREPITSDERQVPAVWNMASAAGKTVAVFGLWATYPAEPVRGLMVADRFASFTTGNTGNTGDQRPPGGVVFPAGREGWARQSLAAASQATGYPAVHRYLPWLGAGEYQRQMALAEPYAHPVSALRRILVETRAYRSLATEWIERARPDLAVVYFQGTDTIGHMFAPYAPPRQPAVSAEDFARYGGVPRLYFAEVDLLLGDFRDLAARQGAVLVLASDHGFRWTEGRPAALTSAAAATAARWHREEGIYLFWAADRRPPAPRSAAGPTHTGARGGVAQVCATLLALLGLPPGAGLAPPLDAARAFAGGAAAEPAKAPVDYAHFFHPAGASRSGAAAAPAGGAGGDDQLAALRALGYIGSGEPTRRTAAGSPAPTASPAPPAAGQPLRQGAAQTARDLTRTAASFDNEGLLLRQAGQPAAAQAAFERAIERQPEQPSALWNLSDLLFAAAEREAAATAAPGGGPAGRLAPPRRPDPPARLALLDRADALLLRAAAAGLPAGIDRVLERATRYGRAGERDRGVVLLDGALAGHAAEPRLWLLHGRYRLEQRRCDAAQDDFTRSLQLDAASPLAHASLGLALLCRGDEAAALAAFRRSLALDPNQPEIRRFLAEKP